MREQETLRDTQYYPSWQPIVLAAIFIISAWALNFLLLYDLSPNERGTFGDMFGAVNSLFSGGALAGVIYAIFLQRREVDLARRELERTKNMLDQQTQALHRDDLARTFFAMIEQVSRVKAEIFVDVSTREGKETRIGERALRDIIIVQRQMLLKRDDHGLQHAREHFENFSRSVEVACGICAAFDEGARNKYENILISSLSHADEWIILFSIFYFDLPHTMSMAARKALFRNVGGLTEEEFNVLGRRIRAEAFSDNEATDLQNSPLRRP